jgi:hypothetical protein
MHVQTQEEHKRDHVMTQSLIAFAASTAAQVAETFHSEVAGRSFIITGANSGIGLETARELLRQGAIGKQSTCE